MVFMEFDEPLDYFVPSHVGLIKEMVLFFYMFVVWFKQISTRQLVDLYNLGPSLYCLSENTITHYLQFKWLMNKEKEIQDWGVVFIATQIYATAFLHYKYD